MALVRIRSNTSVLSLPPMSKPAPIVSVGGGSKYISESGDETDFEVRIFVCPALRSSPVPGRSCIVHSTACGNCVLCSLMREMTYLRDCDDVIPYDVTRYTLRYATKRYGLIF